MIVNYEYWPTVKDSAQDDPVREKRHVNDMQSVIAVIEELKSKYGVNLRCVDVVIRLFKSM